MSGSRPHGSPHYWQISPCGSHHLTKSSESFNLRIKSFCNETRLLVAGWKIQAMSPTRGRRTFRCQDPRPKHNTHAGNLRTDLRRLSDMRIDCKYYMLPHDLSPMFDAALAVFLEQRQRSRPLAHHERIKTATIKGGAPALRLCISCRSWSSRPKINN